MKTNLCFRPLLAMATLIAAHLMIPAVHAQEGDCPGNLVANGNFTAGLANWSAAYGTPDPSTGPGCQDPGFVGMWGNLNTSIGEGLQQVLSTPLVQGKTYVVSVCVKNGTDPSKLPYSRFKLRASTVPLTSVGGGTVIGLTGQITGAAWTPVSFIWTAPTGGPYSNLTLNVENNSNINDGAQTSYGLFDNVCIRELGFTATTACQGQPTSFTSNATGATSWSWSFGDNSPLSTQQNPTHTYANAGTYNVTLCVNGTTSCVTKPVTVKPAPPVPVINGPVTSCNAPATYCVASAVPGVTYNWTVSPPSTIVGSSTGSCVQVNWSPPGTGGWVGVTATNKEGCSSSRRIEVKPCTTALAECCQCNELSVKNETLNGSSFTASVTATPMPITRVAVDLISTSVVPFPGCGTAGSRDSSILQAGSSLPPLVNVSQPVTPGREILFSINPPVTLVSAPLTLNLQLPPISGSQLWCGDDLSFCLKYSFTGRDCKTCELIECYGPYRRYKYIIEEGDLGNVFVNRRFNLRVKALNDDGTTSPAAGGKVLLRLKPGTGEPGAQLLGRTQADLVRGTATFSELAIDKPGEGYVLQVLVSDSREPVGESKPFNVRLGN